MKRKREMLDSRSAEVWEAVAVNAWRLHIHPCARVLHGSPNQRAIMPRVSLPLLFITLVALAGCAPDESRSWDGDLDADPGRDAPVASDRPGTGAVPFRGGTTFRVWAPFAKRVAVAGEFSGWEGV